MTAEANDPGFFSRWSRRKVLARQAGGDLPAPPAAAPAAQPVTDARPPLAEASAAARPVVATPEETPAPTLDDVKALSHESDFSRFLAPDVDPKVKNLAMKKLFTDPHYNVMDGLDTYIDDYNTPAPIPAAMFKQLVQARMLGLLDDELEDQVARPGHGPAPLPHQEHGLQGVGAEQGVQVPAAAPDAVPIDPAAAAELAPADETRAHDGGRAWESNPPGTA